MEQERSPANFFALLPLLSKYDDVMLLADRGFANHQLVSWLKNSQWHYCLRLPCDVTIHGARRHPIELKYLYPAKSEATLYHNVGLWLDGQCRSNFVLANVKGAKEPWAVITDENPTLQTLWQSRGAIRQPKAVGLPKAIALRFRIEELFLDSKSGTFQLEESKIRDRKALERLYLVVALALKLCYFSRYGGSNSWTQTKGRSTLSKGVELS